jgi:hypothetical protein
LQTQEALVDQAVAVLVKEAPLVVMQQQTLVVEEAQVLVQVPMDHNKAATVVQA